MKRKMKRKKIYLCFIDYQKAFDRVRHDKLAEVMVKAGIPDLERRLIINLYWRQHATVRWDGEVSREVGVERGVRQGCVISPILFKSISFHSVFFSKYAVRLLQFTSCFNFITKYYPFAARSKQPCTCR